jgi:hypothetical protein
MKAFALAVIATLVFAAPVYAERFEHHEHHHAIRGAPGPIAGAGLPILMIAGGYFAWKRWRKAKLQG